MELQGRFTDSPGSANTRPSCQACRIFNCVCRQISSGRRVLSTRLEFIRIRVSGRHVGRFLPQDGPRTSQHGFRLFVRGHGGNSGGALCLLQEWRAGRRCIAAFVWQEGDYGNTKILSSGIGLPDWNTRNVGPTILSKARGFIEQSANKPAPFFLLVSTQSAHDPYKPPTEIGSRMVGGASGLSARGDMLVEVDAIVESIVRKLKQLGVLRDTLIIFTSDNGGVRLGAEQRAGHETSGGLRGDKGTIYEGGHRVPLIVKWGDGAFGRSPLPPGSAIDALVGIQDMYATLAALTGTPLPIDQARDSFNLLPLLMGETTAIRDHMVQEADSPEDNAPDGGISDRHFAYRSGPWKLVFDSARNPVGLYNLEVDPLETTNLRSQQAQSARVAEMRMALDTALSSDRTAPRDSGISLTPGSVAFDGQELNIATQARTVRLESIGNAPAPIESIFLAGTNPAQFLLTHDCPASLPVGRTCALRVRFRPTSMGAKSAILRVVTDAGTERKQVQLSGTGTR